LSFDNLKKIDEENYEIDRTDVYTKRIRKDDLLREREMFEREILEVDVRALREKEDLNKRITEIDTQLQMIDDFEKVPEKI